jgi:fructose/tagatose bisphosphate aldolase
MSTHPSPDIIRRAAALNMGLPAFNIPYLPMMEPVTQAIVDQDCIALIATARLEWYKFGAQSLAAVAEEYRKWERPGFTWLHLDHVPVIDEDNLEVDYLPVIRQAIDEGYQSVMVDGSRLRLEDNIEATRRVVEMAHAAGVPCEAELGAVLGHEAGPLPPYEELYASGRGFTDVEEARRFVEETGCDWLSVAIGNIHGAISGVARDQKKPEARLHLQHLDRLKEATGAPLVLHGGSSVKQDYLHRRSAGHREGEHRHGDPPGIRSGDTRERRRRHGATGRLRPDVLAFGTTSASRIRVAGVMLVPCP